MLVKELYAKLPEALKDVLISKINSTLLAGLWDETLTSADMISLTNDIYFSNMKKEISPVINTFFELKEIDVENITEQQFESFIRFLYLRYIDKWTKLFNYIFNQEYNPIWNVDGTETETREFTHGKITTETKALTTETDGENNVVNNVTQNQRNGFNSSSPVDTDKSTNNGSSNGNTTTDETGTDTFVNSGKDVEEFTKTRGGNIGVTSTQNMLEQELELRRKFNYFEIIKTDIINELSLNIY